MNTQTLTVDGKAAVVILDDQGRVLYVIFPFDRDPAGNPATVSFGYGQQVDNLETFLIQLRALLGL